VGLGFFDEFFFALGAGNGDLTFAFGDPDGLAAFGAGVVSVVPVLDLVPQH
jgi:hypothetical protein